MQWLRISPGDGSNGFASLAQIKLRLAALIAANSLTTLLRQIRPQAGGFLQGGVPAELPDGFMVPVE